MSDLVAFLNARLGEDEAAAKAAWQHRWVPVGNSVQIPARPGVPPLPVADAMDNETATHAARHDPARVLREVEAKRRILAEHPYRDEGTYGSGCDNCHWDNEFGFNMQHGGLCNTVRTLAAVYSDHPGYDPAWKCD